MNEDIIKYLDGKTRASIYKAKEKYFHNMMLLKYKLFIIVIAIFASITWLNLSLREI